MERPAPRDAGPDQDEHERDEQHAVDAASDANRKRQAREIFQRHRHEKQDQKRYALDERNEAKLTQRSQYRIISASAFSRAT